MPLRALRLLHHLPTTAEAPTVASARSLPLSFSSTLQLAAGRAWARRVLVHHDSAAARGATRAVHTTVPRRHESPAAVAAAGPSSLKPAKTLAPNSATKAPSLSSTKASTPESLNPAADAIENELVQSSRTRNRHLSKSERLQRRKKPEQAVMSERDDEPVLPSKKSPPVKDKDTADSTWGVGDEQPQASPTSWSSIQDKLPQKRPLREQSKESNSLLASERPPVHKHPEKTGSYRPKNLSLSSSLTSSSANNEALSDTTWAIEDEPVQRLSVHKRPSKEELPNRQALLDLSKTIEVRGTTRPPPPPPPPHSSQSLHQNLLYVLSNKRPVPPLPALIEYHDHYHEYHSTASYNLLMTIAVRHRQHGILQALLHAQEQAGIPKDIDTYVLVIRSLLQRGKWKAGWDYAQQLKDSRVFPKNAANQYEIPFPIWIELCTCPRTPNPQKVYGANGEVSHIISEVVDRGTPKDFLNRQRLLANAKPLDIPPLAYTPPYGIFCLVQLLIRSQDHAGALRLAKEYLSALALRRPTLTRAQNDACLRIVHALVAHIDQKAASPKPEARFYAGQRLLFALLARHPGLRPTARTVFVMLAPLKRALRCGTIAWKEVRIARWKWGAHVVDMAVLRRCAALAHKERQQRILDLVIEAQEELARRAVRTQRVSGPEYQVRRRRMANGMTTPPAREQRPDLNVESVAELHKEEKEQIAWSDRAIFEAVLNGVPSVKLPLNHVYTRAGRERAGWLRLTDRIRFVRMKTAAIWQNATTTVASTTGNSSVIRKAEKASTAGCSDTHTPTRIHSQTEPSQSTSKPRPSILSSAEVRESWK